MHQVHTHIVTDSFKPASLNLAEDYTVQTHPAIYQVTITITVEFLVIGSISPWLGATPALQSTPCREGSYPAR